VQGDASPLESAARLWPPLAIFIAREKSLSAWAATRGPFIRFCYEFLRFGLKQGWACLCGGAMVGLLIGTHPFYPVHVPLARYDFLVVAAVILQILMLAFRLETF
jgi:hypothetical protein